MTLLAATVFASACHAGIGAWSGIDKLTVITDANTQVEVFDKKGKLIASGETNQYGRVWFRIANSQEVKISAAGESRIYQYRTRYDTAR